MFFLFLLVFFLIVYFAHNFGLLLCSQSVAHSDVTVGQTVPSTNSGASQLVENKSANNQPSANIVMHDLTN